MIKLTESIKLQETEQENVNQINDTLQGKTITITSERLERLSIWGQNKKYLTGYWSYSKTSISVVPSKENKHFFVITGIKHNDRDICASTIADCKDYSVE